MKGELKEIPITEFPEFNFKDIEEGRRKILEIRRNLPDSFIRENSRKIAQNIIETETFQKSKKIACFVGVKGEPDTSLILQTYKEKEIFLPKTIGNEIKFFRYEGELKKGMYGIPEPESSTEINPEEIDFFIVPGVIFDTRGFRIGFGKGFYDRALKKVKGKKKIIAIAWKFQIFREIKGEKEGIDIFVDEIYSEEFALYPSLARSSKNSVLVRVFDIFS
jgi:5-formyltetrahydrofolate cyclo-ligase